MENHYLQMVKEYIKDRSPKAFRSAGSPFPHAFIDPGSIYHSNLWDWDSFWTVYALMAFSKTDLAEEGYSSKLEEHAKGGVLNFLTFQLEDGYIPMMIDGQKESGWDSYLIQKHKEGEILNMHKPFLCQQIAVISGYCGSFQWIEDKVEQLERYFNCYDKYYYREESGLYVWADDVMIGMDNDPATFGRPRFSTGNIYLNAFMVSELNAMCKILVSTGKSGNVKKYEKKAKALTEAIQKECWDNRDRLFYSVDVDIKTRDYDWFHKGLGVFWNTLPIKIRTWNSFIPMFSGIATKEQARDIVALHMKDPSTYSCDYGVRTLARDEKMYNLEATNNPSNWLGSVWMVANYVVFRGLMNYGYHSEAEEIYKKSLRLLGEDLKTSGELHEYYNPETGHPVMSPGFLNWNMLVVNMEMELEGKFSAFDFLGSQISQ